MVDNVTIDGNSVTSTSGDLQFKAVSGSNLTIQDDADAAKEVTLVMSSVTSGQDRAWTFPDSDGTFIGAATTETLTNKTIEAGEFTTDLNLNDSVPIRMGTAEDSSISFDGTDLIILTDGAGASGIILDSEDNTVEIKGSGVLQATFDAGGIDLVSGDAYEINDTIVLNATTLGGAVVASSLTSTGALNGGSITSEFGSIVNGASAITTTGTITGGVVVADNLTLDANAITSTDTNGDITITPHGTGNVVLDGVNWPQADGSANTYLKTNGSAQTSWVAGSPAAAVLTTHGDLVFQNSAPANARLAAGTAGQWLQTEGGSADPVWSNTFKAAVIGGDQTLSRVNLKDYGEVTNAIGATGGGTQAIDLTLGNYVTATVDTSANTFTFTNPTASDEGCGFTLVLTNGGSQTVNWPSTVDWEAATAPTLTASGVDILVFITHDAGTTWHGMLASLASA